jgi:hypothetical protein
MECGLGPLALLSVTGWSIKLVAVAFLLVWGGYTFAIACTRFGLAPWWAHAILSTGWCAVGLISACYASLAVT